MEYKALKTIWQFLNTRFLTFASNSFCPTMLPASSFFSLVDDPFIFQGSVHLHVHTGRSERERCPPFEPVCVLRAGTCVWSP